MDVFACYWKAVSSPLAVIVLLSVVLMQLTRNVSDAWLAHWVTDTTLDTNGNDTTANVFTSSLTHLVQPMREEFANDSESQPHTTGYYLGIYASLALTNSLITMARSFLFAFAGLKAAKYIHNKLLNKVMYVSIVSMIASKYDSEFSFIANIFVLYFLPNP